MNTKHREETVGFVGLGQMGGPMAENILKKGHPLVAYDIDIPKVERFVRLGAQAASGPADVARRARTVISMVDTTSQAEEVIVGPGGFIETAKPGDVIISMSTIDPMALKRMHRKLAERGIDIIDAPVTGMEKGAKAGTLKAYVGWRSRGPRASTARLSSHDLGDHAPSRLESLPLRRLSFQEEGFRKLAFTADLERAEVLVPRAVRGLRVGFSPQLQLIEILGGDLTIGDAIEEMLAETRWKIGPSNLRH